MEFEQWKTPFDSGTAWIVDLSWGVKEWTLEKPNGFKYTIFGSDSHRKDELIARVFHESSESLFEVVYESVNGFRILDEHGLTEIWNDSPPKANTFKVKNHGWHKESPLTFFMGNDNEWSHLIATDEECLEVVCHDSPEIRYLGKVPAVKSNT